VLVGGRYLDQADVDGKEAAGEERGGEIGM
jgi:hypothetical protein